MHSLFPKETHFPPKVLYHKGCLEELAGETAPFGPRGVIVHGISLEKSGLRDGVAGSFERGGLEASFFCRGHGEPTLEEISQVIQKGRSLNADWIIGIGGGSVLDLAKAAAGLFRAQEPPLYYQEGGVLRERGLPFIAVPTTAGSGSEATPNAVILNPGKKLKLSIRHPDFLAKKVLLDVTLIQGLPFSILCQSGMDAWVQAYESFVSKHATWFSENLALKAVRIFDRHLLPALAHGREEDLDALLLGSFFSGVAFSHSRLGVIHGIAHPLGALYGFPHGLICASCFVPSLKLNLPAIRQKYEIMSQAVGTDFLTRITDVLRELKIVSPFKGKPVLEKEFIVRETLRSGSTAANPKPVTADDVHFLLDELF
ncbi:MAG: iron-containing alcohol dehydrogenase [Candidatus Omnitrophica bacterium]|nr:iron-containing alcohol dehydrogenase [Candidatus Omnitrophota bacterium]